jgi:hypothetical protein
MAVLELDQNQNGGVVLAQKKPPSRSGTASIQKRVLYPGNGIAARTCLTQQPVFRLLTIATLRHVTIATLSHLQDSRAVP